MIRWATLARMRIIANAALALALISGAALAFQSTSPLALTIAGIRAEYVVFLPALTALMCGIVSWRKKSAKYAVGLAIATLLIAVVDTILTAEAIFGGRGPW